MNEKRNEICSSKVATLSAADLIPRASNSRSPARFSSRPKRSSIKDSKRLSRSPRRQIGFSSPRKTKRFQTSLASNIKKNALQSPKRTRFEPSSTHDVSKPSSAKLDPPGVAHRNSVEPIIQSEEGCPNSEQESVPQSDGSHQLECSVLCVDIDNTIAALNTTDTSEATDKDQTIADDSVSDCQDDGTSSWHPSDDDDASSPSDSERPRPRRAHSGSNASSSAQRSKRKRRRLRCQSDSSATSSPSRETRRNKRSKELSPVADTGATNGMASASDNNTVPESDDYCWICHKVGQMVICSCCPRVYHPACLCVKQFPDTWLCPECQDLLVAECMLYQLPGWKDITPNQLQDMLLFLIDRLATQQWAEHFREPVDANVIEGYKDIVAYPMDLHTIYERILSGAYASTQAFLSEFRWILHNCIIFNGFSSPLTSCARTLDRTCTLELALMRACPLCYIHRMPAIHLLPSTTKTLPPLTKSEWRRSVDLAVTSDSADAIQAPPTLDPWWFCQLCDVLHPVVWVRLQHYPRWPAKVMAVDADNLLVSFFGDYDLTMAPIGSALLHSDSRTVRSYYLNALSTPDGSSRPPDPAVANLSPDVRTPPVSPALCSPVKCGGGRAGKSSTTDPAVDANYKRALTELDYHMSKIRERYPDFKLPATQLEFTRRFYLRFRKSYGNRSIKQSVQPVTTDIPAPQLTAEHAISIAPASFTEQSVASVTQSTEVRNSVEPVLSRVASGLFPSTSTPKRDPTIGADPIAEPRNTETTASGNRALADATLKIASCDDKQPNMSELREPSKANDTERRPSVLHPIPEMNSDDTEGTDEVHTLLERMRSQFNEALQNLEEKWNLTRTANEQKHSMSHEPPILSALTVETEVQTDSGSPPPSKRRTNRSVASTTVKPILVEASTATKHITPSATLSPLQAVLMESEINRLERENQRLNLLLAFTRAEMAFEMRHRIAELRRVWNFEVTAILEAASAIWEQDVIRIVDAVKRKQWCAYCGRVAFYYCCWNTCYCNSVCQAKHWASHITSCVQAKSQQSTVEANSTTSPVGTHVVGTSVTVEKFDRTNHQSMVHWPMIPGHSASVSSAVSTAASANRGQNVPMRGKMNP